MKFKLIEYRADNVSTEGLPTYAGQYTITPKAKQEQVLNTKGKVLQNNITVKAVPLERVTNNGGGYTAIIG